MSRFHLAHDTYCTNVAHYLVGISTSADAEIRVSSVPNANPWEQSSCGCTSPLGLGRSLLLWTCGRVVFQAVATHHCVVRSKSKPPTDTGHPDQGFIYRAMSNTISDKLYSQCRSDDSITAELEKKPSGSPAEFAKHLYGSHGIDHFDKKPPEERLPATQEDLRRAAQCGRFAGTNPSELFLRAYHDMLLSLQHDPLGGVVSPSLLGSTGVVPLTTIGPLHDVARHLSNVIVRAKKEVLLATCSWLAGGSTSFISDALRELSRRAGQRGERIVVKIIYDRGGVKQV